VQGFCAALSIAEKNKRRGNDLETYYPKGDWLNKR
jgi:hypothetical protein